MEFIFIFAIILFEIVFIHFLQVVKIVRALGVDTLMEDEVFPFFFWNEGISTVGAAQLYGREAACSKGKTCGTDLAEELSFGTVILVKKGFWRITAGAGAVIRDIAIRAADDRADFFTIAFLIVRNEILVVPVLTEVSNEREFVNLELLVFWGMGVIKGPLLERDVSADEI